MRIGIAGTGNMARALGAQWSRAYHDVLVGGRDAGRAAALAGGSAHGRGHCGRRPCTAGTRSCWPCRTRRRSVWCPPSPTPYGAGR